MTVQLVTKEEPPARDIKDLERELLVILHRFANSSVLSELLDKFHHAGREVTIGIEVSVDVLPKLLSAPNVSYVENGVVKEGVFTPEDVCLLRILTNAMPLDAFEDHS